MPGVYINSKTNPTDPAMALKKFFGSFNSIMSVLGIARDEMLSVHLVKTYRLPVLLYGSETWSLSSSDKYKLNGSWIIASAEFLMVSGERKSVKPLLFYCNTMPLMSIADQR